MDATVDMGDAMTLKIWRHKSLLIFGEANPAVAYLDDRIAINKPDINFEVEASRVTDLLTSIDATSSPRRAEQSD